LHGYVAASAGAVRDVMRDPNMRGAQLSSAAAWTSEWAFVTALAVYAFEHGGAKAVGIVGFVRVLPAAVSLPFLSALADRMPRQRLLTATGAVRAVAAASAGASALAGVTPVLVYALAAVATIAFTAYRPAHTALIPSLCTTAGELARANAVRTLLDGASALAGPLAIAAVLEAAGAGVAFLVTGVLAAYSALAMALISFEAPPLLAAARRPVIREVRDGFSALVRHPPVFLLAGLAGAQAMVRGALNVLLVVVAVEFMGTGESGVGLLWAAFGAGGLAGAVATFGLVASRRLGALFGVGIALWGIPLALVAATSSTPLALALVAVVGVGNALVDVTIFTLMQRLLDDGVLGRVLGTSEMLWTLALAFGSLLAPVLVSALGARGALLATGLSLPFLLVLTWRGLQRIDTEVEVRDVEIALLQQVPMLRPLPVPAIEQLASRTQTERYAAEELIFRQGDPGDRFYVIAEGEVRLRVDGGENWSLHRGEWFGELALLRPVPRTATARATTNVEVRTLDAQAFVHAVSGFSASTREADAIVSDRLGVAP
jgi:MFS family permease